MSIHLAARRRTLSGSLALLLLVLSFAWSTASSAEAGTQAGSTQAEGPDGETMFRAIFFLEGEIAEENPQLVRERSAEGHRSLTPEQKKKLRAAQNRVIRELKKRDPAYFEKLRADLSSGDRARISQRLRRTARDVEEVAGGDRAMLGTASNSGTVVVVWNILFVDKPLGDITTRDADSEIFHEELVDSLASQLKAPSKEAESNTPEPPQGR